MPKVEVKSVRVKALLDAGQKETLHLPPYQRPASWDPKKIAVFFDSFMSFVVSSNSSQHDVFYLGEMVFDGKNRVVDGQQRILAITVIACAVRDALIELGEHKRATEVAELIRFPSNGKPRFSASVKNSESDTFKQLQKLIHPRIRYNTNYTVRSITDDNSFTIKLRGNTKHLAVEKGSRCYIHHPTKKIKPLEIVTGIRFGKGDGTDVPDMISMNKESHGMDDSWIGGEIHFVPVAEKLDARSNFHKSYLEVFTKYFHLFSDVKFSKSWKNAKSFSSSEEHEVSITCETSSTCQWPMSNDVGSSVSIELTKEDGSVISKEVKLTKPMKGYTKSPKLAFKPDFDVSAIKKICVKASKMDVDVSHTRFSKKFRLITVARTTFTDESDALSYFTISNNQAKREPLWNFDLFHALAYSFGESPELSTEQKSKLRDDWAHIRESRFLHHTVLKNRQTKSDQFITQFMLGQGILQSGRARFKAETDSVNKFDSYENHLRRGLALTDEIGTWQVKVVDQIAHMKKFSECLAFVEDPRHNGLPDDYGTYNAETISLLLILNKLRFSSHHPLCAQLLVGLSDETYAENRNLLLLNFLKHLISRVVRNFIYGKDRTLSIPGFKQLKENDIWKLYTKEGGWLDIVHGPQTFFNGKMNDLNVAIPQLSEALEELVAKIGADDGAVDYPLRHILSYQKKSDFKQGPETNKGLCWLFTLADSNDGEIQNLLLTKIQKVDGTMDPMSAHPDVEHILPDDWGLETEDAWPAWQKFSFSDHSAYSQFLGNMSLLEYNINRSIKGGSLFWKSGGVECPITNATNTGKGYKDSKYTFLKELSEECAAHGFDAWSVDKIKSRTETMLEKICTYLDGTQT